MKLVRLKYVASQKPADFTAEWSDYIRIRFNVTATPDCGVMMECKACGTVFSGADTTCGDLVFHQEKCGC